MASERLWCSLLRPAALALLLSPLSRGFSIYKINENWNQNDNWFQFKTTKAEKPRHTERERGGEDNEDFDRRRSSETVMKWIFVTINKISQMCRLSTLASVSGFDETCSHEVPLMPPSMHSFLLSLSSNVYGAQIVIWSHGFTPKCVQFCVTIKYALIFSLSWITYF